MAVFIKVGGQVLFRFPNRRAAYAFVLTALSSADRATVATVGTWSLWRGEHPAAEQLSPPGRLAADAKAWAGGWIEVPPEDD